MERKEHNLRAIILKVFIMVNALFLFGLNVDQVSAEAFDESDQSNSQSEVISEEIPSTEETVEDEDIADEQTPPEKPSEDTDDTNEDGIVADDEDAQEDFGEESSEENQNPVEATDDSSEQVTDETSSDTDVEEPIVEEPIVEEPNPEDSTDVETEQTSDEIQNELESDKEIGEGSDEDQSQLDVDEEADAAETLVDEEPVVNEEPLPEIATASTLAVSANKSANGVEIDRIAGSNRYKNAVEVSKAGWKNSSKVILTNGEKFTDSLTGSPLASLYKSPILLTKSGSLPTETLEEIKRLNPNEVIILGGNLSISEAILNTLNANGFTTRRLGGNNRYKVAENIANEIMTHEGKNRDALLVSGEVFADGMSIAPVASASRLPIFLTKGNVLNQAVINAIPYVNSWTLIGGNGTISNSVETQMKNLGAQTKRIGGQNRYEVNRNVISYYGASGDSMYVVSGELFSDALPTSVLAAKEGKAVLLLENNNRSTLRDQKDFAQKRHGFKKFTFIGGPLTLSAKTAKDFSEANKVVYLDAGHGGSDSGAVGKVNGITYREADLNLAVSLKVRNLLESQGYDVVMSRTNNSTVDIFDRPAEANRIGADILVSIHHNAMPNSTTTTGIETFYYQSSSDYPPLNENKPYHNNSQRLNESRDLANLIQGELIDHTGATNRGVKSAAFVVVREARMPAVLLELGFMNAPSELNKLRQNSYQNNMATAITDGISRYFA